METSSDRGMCRVCGSANYGMHDMTISPAINMPGETMAVLNFISTLKGVSMYELEKQFPFAKGEHDWNGTYGDKILLWNNMSMEMIHIMTHLIHSDQIVIYPSTALEYAIHGRVLKPPVLRRSTITNEAKLRRLKKNTLAPRYILCTKRDEYLEKEKIKWRHSYIPFYILGYYYTF